jgi:hypothetical protein
MNKKKQLLFSVTAADCEWSYSAGTGNGGQARNKSKSAVHCHHLASGARAYCQDGRSQQDNKRAAFVKMCGTSEFKNWHRREVWKHLGILDEIELAVQDGLNPSNLKMEIKVDGKWVEIPLDAPLDIDEENLTVTQVSK